MRLISLLLSLLSTSLASLGQTTPSQVKKPPYSLVNPPTSPARNRPSVNPASAGANPFYLPTKKDGTPDMRYKANKKDIGGENGGLITHTANPSPNAASGVTPGTAPLAAHSATPNAFSKPSGPATSSTPKPVTNSSKPPNSAAGTVPKPTTPKPKTADNKDKSR